MSARATLLNSLFCAPCAAPRLFRMNGGARLTCGVCGAVLPDEQLAAPISSPPTSTKDTQPNHGPESTSAGESPDAQVAPAAASGAPSRGHGSEGMGAAPSEQFRYADSQWGDVCPGARS